MESREETTAVHFTAKLFEAVIHNEIDLYLEKIRESLSLLGPSCIERFTINQKRGPLEREVKEIRKRQKDLMSPDMRARIEQYREQKEQGRVREPKRREVMAGLKIAVDRWRAEYIDLAIFLQHLILKYYPRLSSEDLNKLQTIFLIPRSKNRDDLYESLRFSCRLEKQKQRQAQRHQELEAQKRPIRELLIGMAVDMMLRRPSYTARQATKYAWKREEKEHLIEDDFWHKYYMPRSSKLANVKKRIFPEGMYSDRVLLFVADMNEREKALLWGDWRQETGTSAKPRDIAKSKAPLLYRFVRERIPQDYKPKNPHK